MGECNLELCKTSRDFKSDEELRQWFGQIKDFDNKHERGLYCVGCDHIIFRYLAGFVHKEAGATWCCSVPCARQALKLPLEEIERRRRVLTVYEEVREARQKQKNVL